MRVNMAKSYRMVALITNKAFQGLREWLDPAIEGDPYSVELIKKEKTELKRSFFPSRKFGWR